MRVLIIEENESRYKQIKESLQRVTSPFITWCRTGSSGLVSIKVNNVKKSSYPYDFVILDNTLTVNTLYNGNSFNTRYIVDEIRKLGLDDLPIVICSLNDIEDCDYNYQFNYNSSENMDNILKDVLRDIDAHDHIKEDKQIYLSIKNDMNKLYPKSDKIDYTDVLGRAIIINRTEIKDKCSNYSKFDSCNILDCLYCDNCNYMILLAEYNGIIKSLKSLYSYPKEHLNGLIDNDHELLFYDRIPQDNELYDYLFDQESKYIIIRKIDNEIIVDTTKMIQDKIHSKKDVDYCTRLSYHEKEEQIKIKKLNLNNKQ